VAHINVLGVSVPVNQAFIAVTNPPVLVSPTYLTNGAFQFAFTNMTGTSFTVFASTNLVWPFNIWSNLGPAVETPAGSGQFQFTDLQTTNNSQRFYSVRTP
jgi:hypothetical protein